MRRLLILLLLLSPIAGEAQRPFNDDYFLFESSDAVKINEMIQDSIGYMWLGTDLGLYRFNGQGDLTPIYDTIHKPVTALYNANGLIYAGYQNGTIGRVINDSISILPVRQKKPSATIRAMLATPGGLLFTCTDKGLFCILNGAATNVNRLAALPDGAYYALAASRDGALMTCSSNGVYKIGFTGGKLWSARIVPAGSFPEDSIRVLKPVPRSDVMWCGGKGIARIDPARNGLLSYAKPWHWGRISDILVRDANHFWAATEDGFLLEVKTTDSIRVKPYYYGKHYTKLLRSKSGNIWCGTDQGLSSVGAEFAAYLNIPAPYSMYQLTSMAIDRQHQLWFSQDTKLLCMPLKDSGGRQQLMATVSAPITSLYADNNTTWIGTTAGLWYKAYGRAAKKVSGIKTLERKDITSISRGGPEDHLWIAGEGGVEELETGTGIALIKHHDKQSGLSSNDVYQVLPDHTGKIWIATDSGGVCSYDGSHYTCWDSASGFNSKTAYSITEDAFGNIWAGTPGKGLYRYDGKRWQRFGRENGLQDLNISAVMANKTGQVIIINQAGVDEWYPRSVQFRHFNARTAPSIDSTATVINCIAKDTAGNVYVASTIGLSIFTNIESQLELKPSIHINKINVLFKPIPKGKHIFSYKENHISFQYEGINFVNLERLNYRYRLDGYSDDWTFTDNEPVNFPQLSPGTYTFRLQASLDKDFEEAREIDYAFEIRSPLWEKPWFIALMIALLSGLIYAYIKLREKNLKKVAALKQERMLFEYEHLKSQVNPHFLFNSLNTLTNLIEENQQYAIDYTVQLSALYRNILTYRNKDTILLAEECRLLQSYLYIQKRRFGRALHCESKIPQQLLDTCRVVPLALQLLVENAIKHNMVTTASPLHICIGVTDEQEIIVRNKLKPKMSKEGGAGLGLQNIQRRYALLTKKPVQYGVAGNEYLVKLPLL